MQREWGGGGRTVSEWQKVGTGVPGPSTHHRAAAPRDPDPARRDSGQHVRGPPSQAYKLRVKTKANPPKQASLPREIINTLKPTQAQGTSSRKHPFSLLETSL